MHVGACVGVRGCACVCVCMCVCLCMFPALWYSCSEQRSARGPVCGEDMDSRLLFSQPQHSSSAFLGSRILPVCVSISTTTQCHALPTM